MTNPATGNDPDAVGLDNAMNPPHSGPRPTAMGCLAGPEDVAAAEQAFAKGYADDRGQRAGAAPWAVTAPARDRHPESGQFR